jgi:hypothetical protein
MLTKGIEESGGGVFVSKGIEERRQCYASGQEGRNKTIIAFLERSKLDHSCLPR